MNRGFYSIPRNRTYKEPTGSLSGSINIPQPIPYRTTNASDHHVYNEPLPGTPGTITNSWTEDILKLTYQTSDLIFLNYRPKYFLFVYKGSHTSTKKNARLINEKYGKYFSHPSNASGTVNAGIIYDPTYANFSGGSGNKGSINGHFGGYRTEWDVNNNTGKPTSLTNFNPLRFYWNNYTNNRASEFFPWPVSNVTDLSVITCNKYKKWPGTRPGVVAHPRINLYIKFAIVIQNPSDIHRYIIGPMSDTVKIFPKSGYFDDGGGTNKYYYTWGTKIV